MPVVTDPRRSLHELLAEASDLEVLLINPESTYAAVEVPDIMLDTSVTELALAGASHFPGDSDYEPNHGLLQLASMLRASGIAVDVLDLNTVKYLLGVDSDLSDIVERWLVDRQPRVVGLSAMMPNLVIAKRWSSLVRDVLPGAIQLIGGLATEAPAELLAGASFDFVCAGRAGQDLIDMIRYLVDHGRPTSKITFVPAMPPAMRRHRGSRMLDVPEVTAAYDLLPRELPLIPRVFASSGCGAGCDFCSPAAALGYKVTMRKAEEVGAEVAYLHNRYDFECWLLGDLTLYLRAREIVKLIGDVLPAMNVKPWWCQSQVTLVSAEMLAQLRAANCRHIALGVEDFGAPAPSVRRKHRGYQQTIDALRDARIAGLATQAYWMFGLPSDTFTLSMDRIKQMSWFVKEGLIDAMHISFLVPYPGTSYFDEAASHGLSLDVARYGDFIGSAGGYYNCLPMHATSNLAAREIFALTRLAVASVALEYGRLRQLQSVGQGILVS